MHDNLFSRLWSLVAGEIISAYVRTISAIIAVALVFCGYEPFFSPDAAAYQAPVFAGVRELRLELWGAWFLIDALLMMFAAISGRMVWYAIGVFFSTLTLFGWASVIILTDWLRDDADLTSGAIGLYLMSGVAVLGLAFSPRQMRAERPIVAVTESDEVIPLRRVS